MLVSSVNPMLIALTNKTTMKIIKATFFALCLVFAVSCSKPETEGLVNVVEFGTERPVAGAIVTLSVENTDPTRDQGFFVCNSNNITPFIILETNPAGFTETVCFKLPVVVKVDVTTPNGMVGSGTLSVVQEETSRVTIKVQ